MPLQRFIIERDIPKVGTFDSRQLKEAAIKSNEVLKQLGTDIQWIESYISEDKIFCVYLAASDELIREHAARSAVSRQQDHPNPPADRSDHGALQRRAGSARTRLARR